jgi:integrase
LGTKRDVDPVLGWEWDALRQQVTGDYATFFPLLVMTGVRTSEALALQSRDLWADGDMVGITVKRLKRRDGRHDRLAVANRQLFGELERLGRAKRPLLFPFSRVAAWKALRRFCAAAGIRPLSPHQFRHTYAVLFCRTRQLDPITGHAMSALDMQIQLAHNLGHTSIATVETYFRPHGEDLLGRTASVGESFSAWFD